MTVRRGALALVALALLGASCRKPDAMGASGDGPARATDGGANAPAPRVVSLSPSTTEAMFAIGAGKELVARSRYCDFPPEVRALPQVGGYVDPSLEAILGVGPTLVVGARGPAGTALTDKLGARGVSTFFPPTESVTEITAMISGLGERTGHAEGAKAAAARIARRIEDVERAVASAKPVRVLLVFGLSPLSVAGPAGFPDEMIRRAGGRNVVTEGGAYPLLGLERVVVLDPDLIVNAAMGEAKADEAIAKDRPGWASVRAVREGRVVRIRDEVILRPGPRIGEALAELARTLHPEATIPPAEGGP